jgi:DNA-binding response OmpR family regulator
MQAEAARTVIVFEQDALQRDVMVLALQRGGFRAVVCATLEELQDVMEQVNPRALVLDAMQHGINGLELLSQLRREGRLAATRAMVISSLGFPLIVQRARECGAHEFMLKPFGADEFLARLERMTTPI